MSAINDILEKLDELKAQRDNQRQRRDELVRNAQEAKNALQNAEQAIDDFDEMAKHHDEKISMLDMILTALKNELEVKTEAAKQYMLGIGDDAQRDLFVDFMMTQDVYLGLESVMITSTEATKSDCHESTPEPET